MHVANNHLVTNQASSDLGVLLGVPRGSCIRSKFCASNRTKFSGIQHWGQEAWILTDCLPCFRFIQQYFTQPGKLKIAVYRFSFYDLKAEVCQRLETNI